MVTQIRHFFIILISLLLYTAPAISLPSTDDEEAPYGTPVRVLTGGYEATLYEDTQGPRTQAVKDFLSSKNIPFRLETMLWSRAYNLTQTIEDILIYPLTRTKEREDHFKWIKKINEHTFHLIGHKGIMPNNLTKNEIISGDYYAVCEANKSNCSILLEYGFKEKNIFRVKGATVDKVVELLAQGRASFMMENIDIVNYVQEQHPWMKNKIEKVKGVSVTREDYLAASTLSASLKEHLYK